MQEASRGGGEDDTTTDGSTKTESMKDPLDDEDAPPLIGEAAAMAMFVPLEESLFEPFEAPESETDRVKISLRNIEKHTAAVQQNILFLHERERRRIVRYAKAMEAANGMEEIPTGPTPGDNELMIAYMATPEMPTTPDYNNRHLTTYAAANVPTGEYMPRQAAIFWQLFNAGQAVIQLEGYTFHADAIKSDYKLAMAKAIAATIDVLGRGPPEGDTTNGSQTSGSS